MRYGCIGEHLSHSFSKEIHNMLADYPYEIHEVEKARLDDFMAERDFLGINVTIPYKELVIPHLHYIDDAARRIGAVNTIVNRDGLLYGYNTDFYGMSRLIAHAGVRIKGKRVAILGTGGTAKTAHAVCEALGASEIISVSREERCGVIDYASLSKKGSDIDVIINTTPVGMYPNIYASPVSIDDFPNLSGVIDAIYNPLRSILVASAKERGIAAEGGLYMLVAQAVRAAEIFLGEEFPKGTLESVYERMLRSKENIVLIGMPASGKSTVGRILAEALGRELIDTDEVIEGEARMEISEIFAKYGEAEFRDMESRAVREVSKRTMLVIATGGGAILREENVRALKSNGRLFFLNRPEEMLIPTDSRPLARNVDAIKARYAERYPIYTGVADEMIDGSLPAETVAQIIGEKCK